MSPSAFGGLWLLYFIHLIRRNATAILTFLLVLLAVSVPAEAHAEVDVQTEQLARWQLNNADLLVDEGKYLEAISYINSALEESRYPKTRSDALRAKAMVLAIFLDAATEALEVYRELAREFPDQSEPALYQSGFLLQQAGDPGQARELYLQYMRTYPQGKYVYQVEAMLSRLGKGRTDVPQEVPEQAEERGAAPVLRVALGKAAQSATFSTSSQDRPSLFLEDGSAHAAITIAPAGDGLVVNGRQHPAAAISLKSTKPCLVAVDGRRKLVRGNFLIRNDRGRLLVLNLVDIEGYLLSVVPSESYASWPAETLKAQAIAARTYAYYQKIHRAGRSYDIIDDTRDQMYGGVSKETAKTSEAVKQTAGMVLTWNNKPILSQYTANSGGYTADAGAVFGTVKPYLVAQSDPASLAGKMASWERSFTVSQIVGALRAIGVDVEGLSAIEPVLSGPSGRILKARLRHAKGETVVRMRTTLASSRVLNLPEVLVSIDRQGDTFVFTGRGHGHGVGYSQWGAAELGKSRTHEQILGFYYPKTRIERLWK